MFFNSIEFFVFFGIFFFFYWFLFKNLKIQNGFLLISSYFFYAWWDWRFLSLLLGISLINYFLGISIAKTENERHKKILVIIGVVQGIGSLLIFKYFNFFISSLVIALAGLHVHLNIHTLNIILPLGISFYTFRTMSYLFDVERNKIKPTHDRVVFFSYVAFFPSLISGPIDRATTLIPQLERRRVFQYDQSVNGMRQILWGLFKKIVIADNCANFTSPVFDNYQSFSGITLILSAILFTIQIYADFSGYSDMAIGFARLIGFSTTKNFDFPLFAQNIAEFWRRWHISLTTWLTDYVFTPLSIAFRDMGQKGLILAIIINFTLIGIWHGANWTFVLFGFVHGCAYIPLILRGTLNKRKKLIQGRLFPSFRELLNILATFSFVTITIVLFRSDNIINAIDYIERMVTGFLNKSAYLETIKILILKSGLALPLLLIVFLTVEWVGKEKEFAIQYFALKRSRFIRWSFYSFLIFLIGMYMNTTETPFLYFKF